MKADAPAFPKPADSIGPNGELSQARDGMTLRQWYAGLAMQGILANSSTMAHVDKASRSDQISPTKIIVIMAEIQADDMIAQLDKAKP